MISSRCWAACWRARRTSSNGQSRTRRADPRERSEGKEDDMQMRVPAVPTDRDVMRPHPVRESEAVLVTLPRAARHETSEGLSDGFEQIGQRLAKVVGHREGEQ